MSSVKDDHQNSRFAAADNNLDQIAIQYPLEERSVSQSVGSEKIDSTLTIA